MAEQQLQELDTNVVSETWNLNQETSNEVSKSKVDKMSRKLGTPATDEFGPITTSAPTTLSELEATISLSDFSGQEIQELVTEYPLLEDSLTRLIDSKNHQDHPYAITLEENAANTTPPGDEDEILEDDLSIASVESLPFNDSDLWNNDIGVEVFSTNPLSKIRGELIQNHKMKYFGK